MINSKNSSQFAKNKLEPFPRLSSRFLDFMQRYLHLLLLFPWLFAVGNCSSSFTSGTPNASAKKGSFAGYSSLGDPPSGGPPPYSYGSEKDNFASSYNPVTPSAPPAESGVGEPLNSLPKNKAEAKKRAADLLKTAQKKIKICNKYLTNILPNTYHKYDFLRLAVTGLQGYLGSISSTLTRWFRKSNVSMWSSLRDRYLQRINIRRGTFEFHLKQAQACLQPLGRCIQMAKEAGSKKECQKFEEGMSQSVVGVEELSKGYENWKNVINQKNIVSNRFFCPSQQLSPVYNTGVPGAYTGSLQSGGVNSTVTINTNRPEAG